VITGQMVVRLAMESSPNGKPGDELLMMAGLMSVPKGLFAYEHQYTFLGRPDGLIVLTHSPIDVSSHIRGDSIGNALLRPIWRV